MQIFRSIATLSVLSALTGAVVLPSSYQRRSTITVRDQHNVQTDVDGFIQELKSHNLSKLADTLQNNQDVARTILESPGTKTFLAPDDDAITGLPQWVTSNERLLQSTLLMHALNGTYDLSLIPAKPLNLVGHSLLTDSQYANLPGGNGQAVALAFDGGNAVVQEASNTNSFVPSNDFQFGDVAVRPLARAMTVPGNATATLAYLSSHSQLLNALQAQSFGQSLDDLRGATIFVPTDEALQRYVQSKGVQQDQSKLEILIKQHILAYRTAYGVLLGQQGSMINAAGQNVVYDQKANSITVGQSTAKIVQYDIMFRGGVMHLLDNVLGEETYNEARAQQAAQSAQRSANSAVAGPISYQNSASSQGNSVPGPDSNNSNDGYRNSTITTHDASSGGNGTNGQGANGSGGGINNGGRGSDGSGNGNGSSNGAATLALTNACVTFSTLTGIIIVSLLTL
ncbi:FAS1 domain-containing protein [Ceraceosorus guamensis]|uniref:FAS1 domain-containing protein n=1 Tax=Ceraceosorus guamensis TaxID=1522189 RepID=A0A316VS49_9BASI|nr:FAS1 domain-containing protein [Ceraceosorus guamensis]PWN40332.1 FAS1 domain-containing protein [Ceraceosorus guamensis]